jgi:hypothetical protein
MAGGDPVEIRNCSIGSRTLRGSGGCRQTPRTPPQRHRQLRQRVRRPGGAWRASSGISSHNSDQGNMDYRSAASQKCLTPHPRRHPGIPFPIYSPLSRSAVYRSANSIPAARRNIPAGRRWPYFTETGDGRASPVPRAAPTGRMGDSANRRHARCGPRTRTASCSPTRTSQGRPQHHCHSKSKDCPVL